MRMWIVIYDWRHRGFLHPETARDIGNKRNRNAFIALNGTQHVTEADNVIEQEKIQALSNNVSGWNFPSFLVSI